MKLSGNEFIDRMMAPSARLMSKFDLRTKLIGMLSAFLVAILVLGLSLLTKQNSELNVAKDELLGLTISQQSLDLIQQIQADRLLFLQSTYSPNDAKLQAALAKSRKDIGLSLSRLSSRFVANDELELREAWTSTSKEINSLLDDKTRTNFLQYQNIVQLLHRFNDLTQEKSGLLFDPEAESDLLMDLGLQKSPEWIESLSQLSVLSSQFEAQTENTTIQMAQLLSARDILKKAVEQTLRRQEGLKRGNEKLPAILTTAVQQSQVLNDLVQRQLSGDRSAVNKPQLANAIKQANDSVLRLQKEFSSRLQSTLQNRVSFNKAKSYAILWILLGSIAITLYFTFGFYLNFIGAIGNLEVSAEIVASGNLTQVIHIEGKDELAKTGYALDQMNYKLSALVANVRTNASMVLELGQNLTEGINDMSIRTEQQANSLLDTTNSLEALSETVKTNASNAKSVDNLASNVRMIAESSNEVMLAAVETMNGIHESAMKVHEIVSMIDRIAFQTDILALNAAVEAAHAGEQGKGFAVVASEVRSLAQRSADSARQIRRLIDDSVNRVEAGVEQINDVSMTLTDIVSGIRNLAKSINEISVASTEQSEGLIHISDSIKELDAITKSNSQMAENAKYASSELENRAVRLKEVVSTFSLRQGTADEAFALVKKATALFRIAGMDVLQRITTDAEKQFSDRDMYVFAFDRQGQYRAFAGNESKLEVNLLKVPGLDGRKLVDDAFALPDKGGWVDYSIENPVTKRVEWKSSYIERISDDVVIGCGVYKSV